MDRAPSPPRGWSRRELLALGLGLWAFGPQGLARAGTAGVPPARQAELLAKAGKYDRAMPSRARDGALRLLFASRTGSIESGEFVMLARQRLAEIGRIGKLPLVLGEIAFEDTAELLARIETDASAIVFLSTGLRSSVTALADELRGRSLLTVAASPDDVALGAVLGFDLRGGSPTLLVNLARARAQGVDFHSSLLKLAKIVE